MKKRQIDKEILEFIQQRVDIIDIDLQENMKHLNQWTQINTELFFGLQEELSELTKQVSNLKRTMDSVLIKLHNEKK